ncbi:uncharacterized protein LOC124661856 [Lolium rigidum]|uniref:uncharacterized protein LOC124661856 n=1 Tax=Lolium rigidum TaxID=89674 RepID=UPI001F5E1395|nr:uncharacterized protein LOC124661856 [Lolium rigidum]
MDREAAADLQEWELLLASPTAPAPYAGGGEDDAGAIKYDYFELGSDAKYARRASMSMAAAEEEEEGTDEEAGSAGWVEPHPDALAFPARDRAALWSDSSSDGERRDEAEPLAEPPQDVTAVPAADEGTVAKGGAAPAPWWKLPMEVLRLWAARAARSAWSVPVAVALLGFAVLGRRLYRMRRQSKAVARVRLVLDDKKASQFKAQRMLRRAPMIKPLLPANGVTPWPVLGHL